MKKIALAAVLGTMMAAASAQVYVGGNVGQARTNVDCSDSLSCDKSDTGYKLTVGYKLNPTVALEAAYVNFGKVKARYLDDDANPFSVEVKGHGVLLAAAFRYPVMPTLNVVGRLGMASLKAKGSSSLGTSDSESSTKPYVGLGAEYALTKELRLTAAADFTRAKFADDSYAVRLLSLGAQYDF